MLINVNVRKWKLISKGRNPIHLAFDKLAICIPLGLKAL